MGGKRRRSKCQQRVTITTTTKKKEIRKNEGEIVFLITKKNCMEWYQQSFEAIEKKTSRKWVNPRVRLIWYSILHQSHANNSLVSIVHLVVWSLNRSNWYRLPLYNYSNLSKWLQNMNKMGLNWMNLVNVISKNVLEW